MMLLTQLQKDQSALRLSFKAARSPKYWQQTISQGVTPTFEAIRCCEWPKHISITPRVHTGVVVGHSFAKLFDDETVESVSDTNAQRNRQTPTVIDKLMQSNSPLNEKVSCKDVSSNTQSPQSLNTQLDHFKKKPQVNRPTDVLAATTKSDIGGSVNINERKRNSLLNQVLEKQKTASVTSLQQWSNAHPKNTSQKIPSNDSSSLKKNHMPSRPLSLVQETRNKKTPIPTSYDQPSQKKQLQRQTSDRIDYLMTHLSSYFTAEKTQDSKNKKSTHINSNWHLHHDQVWQNRLIEDSMPNSKVSSQMLHQLLNKQKNSRPTHPSASAQTMLNQNQKKKPNNNAIASPFPSTEKRIVGDTKTQPTPLKSSHSDRLDSFQKPLDPNIPNVATVTTGSTHVNPLFASENKGLFDKLTNEKSNSDNHVFAKPEFPPIKKYINDDLNPSGQRTPLKSESQVNQLKSEPTKVSSIDETDLAEALKRIIDEQARRHGIDV